MRTAQTEQFFAQLRREVDLPTIVGADTALDKLSEDHYRGPCPFCDARSRSAFAVYRDSGGWWYKCHRAGCRVTGDAVRFLTERKGYTVGDAVAMLREQLAIPSSPIRTADIDRCAVLADRSAHRALLAWSENTRFERAREFPVSNKKDAPSALRWWYAQGLDNETIDRFHVGFCAACPTAFDPANPDRKFPSFTIPIFDTDPESGERRLLNIRHRLLKPPTPSGDKYRPHAKGLGLQLYNLDSLSRFPDGSPREQRDRETCVIKEGEKKVQVLSRHGADYFYPLVTSTGGAGSWVGKYGEEWANMLLSYGYKRYVFLLDPDAQDVAEEAARMFGRYGFVASFPYKTDDYINEYVAGADRAVDHVLGAIDDARPAYGR